MLFLILTKKEFCVDKTDHMMSIWIGITGQKRSWQEQIEGYAGILNKLLEEYNGLTVIIDGMTATYGQVINNSEDSYVCEEIKSRLNRQININ